MSSQNQIKETMVKGLKEILQSSILSSQKMPRSSTFSNYSSLQQNFDNDLVVIKNFAKSVKYFVENSLSNDIEDHMKDITNTSKETWKIDAHNVSKVILEQSKMSCVQDNLSNVLDTCLNEINCSSLKLKYNNELDLDVSPLLQPGHIIEIAECMSAEKPIDVRLNALQILIKSHFSEAVGGEGWPLLQKKLVDNLCDNNNEVFISCLKAHRKLASCSSPEALKECVLNLVDSLGQHYYNQTSDCRSLSFQNNHFYRMANLTILLLDSLKEAISNVARFGESRLEEMIDNVVQLLAIRTSSKQPRCKMFLSPLEIFSYLDPKAKWLLYLTHFHMSRQLLFLSVNKNTDFVRIILEEIVIWLSEPVLPLQSSVTFLKGELNPLVHKYCIFCHSFSIFIQLCSFSIGCSLFPAITNKREDSKSVADIVNMTVVLINDTKFMEILANGPETFKTFFAQNIAKLLCMKEINGSAFLSRLLKANENQEPFDNSTIIKILEYISNYHYANNPFLNIEVAQKRKNGIFFNCFKTCKSQGSLSTKQKREIERQSLVRLSINDEINDVDPFEIYLKLIKDMKMNKLKESPCLIQIMTRMIKNFDKFIFIPFDLRAQTVQRLAETYITLQDAQKVPGYNFDNKDTTLSNCISEFLLQTAKSPLGFYLLQEFKVIAPLLLDRFQRPILDWHDAVWLLFVSKAATTAEGCEVLANKSNEVFKTELNFLWNTIEEDCSGSDLPIEDASNKLLKIVSVFSMCLKGVKAVFKEPRDGSEVTLTDDSEIRPVNLNDLIQQFSLDNASCNNFVYHHFSLKALEMLISNIDSSLYLQSMLNYQDTLLKLQSLNRIDEHSEVIIDECSLLRQKIIEQTYLPCPHRADTKPTHAPPRPESTMARTKPRSRGTGELTRWLVETKQGLHDHSWLKHARKLYKNSCVDDVRSSTVQDLLEQVVKVSLEYKPSITWMDNDLKNVTFKAEEQLAIELVMRYGSYHRLIQPTQQNTDNFTQLITLTKASLALQPKTDEGFDWFVATVYLLCSGNIEKSQGFLSLFSSLPTAPLLWLRLGKPSFFAELGSVLETVVAEEVPALFYSLQNIGLSCWQLCHTWISQSWWNVLEWPQICHWIVLAILHQLDHLIYFCVAVLQANHDRILRLSQQGTLYEVITNPVEKFQLTDVRLVIEKLHKKYHNSLHADLSLLSSSM